MVRTAESCTRHDQLMAGSRSQTLSGVVVSSPVQITCQVCQRCVVEAAEDEYGKSEFNALRRVVVSVSTSRSRDVFFKRLGLVWVSAKCGKVSVSSRTESQTSRSRLGLGPQRLVYKWTFKQIFLLRLFLSFSYSSSVGLHLFNDDSFATLRPLALQLFSAPCSSAASARVFSQSGLIMRPTRSRLSPSRLAKVAKLVFLKCNKHADCGDVNG